MEVFQGKSSKEKTPHTNAHLTELRRSQGKNCSICSVHNWMEQKMLNLKNVFAQVHLLNEWLYEMDKTKNIVRITRWQRCYIIPWVINKVLNLALQFQHIKPW